MDTGALSELIKTKVASLIQEHLKPIINELAAQQRMLQTHSSLLKHNHNVNDYQMARLENLRDLEQSINFKVAGALGFDPWQHPTMGTNLREPVPADPRLIPRFTPENATPTQRAAESAELIAQAGVSARRLGVPLTLQDFPRDPAIHSGGENEDPMHSAVPLFGIRAPRWRAKEGLPPDVAPGLATYNGVPAPPAGKKGKRLYAKRAQKLNPKWKTFEAATRPSSSSSTLDKLFDLLDGPALAGPSGSSANAATRGGASASGVTRMPESPGRATVEMSTTSSSTHLGSPNPFAPAPLASTPTITPVPNPAPPPAPTMIPVPVPRPTPMPTATPLALDGASPSLTVEPRMALTSTTTFDATHASSIRNTGQADSRRNEQIRSSTPTAPSSTSTSTLPVPTPPSLKRTHMAAGLENNEDENGGGGSSSHDPMTMVMPPTRTSTEPQIKQEEPESGTGLEPEPEPQRKRRRRSAAPSPSPSIGLGGAAGGGGGGGGGGWPGPGQLRRSTRVARAHACAMAVPTTTTRHASRRRNTNGSGKRATTRS